MDYYSGSIYLKEIIMEDQNEINFENILRRAKTFSSLPFYNKKYASPYNMAAFGFQNSIASKDTEFTEAKC